MTQLLIRVRGKKPLMVCFCGQVAMFSELNTHNLERYSVVSTLEIYTNSCSKKTYCTKISTNFFHFNYIRLRTMKILKYHHVYISYGGLDSQLKTFFLWSLCLMKLWLLNFPFVLCCTFLRDTFETTSHRKLSTTQRENDGCAKLFNENNDHVIKV